MRSGLISTIFFAFYVLAASGTPVKREDDSADSDFLHSCSDITFDTTSAVVSAVCKRKSGYPVPSSISLDLCIGNSSGRLVAQTNGDFTTTCSGLTLTTSGTSAAALSAMCTDVSLTLTSSIDINSVLTNVNGILTC